MYRFDQRHSVIAHRNYADLFGWRDGWAHDGFDQLLARITVLAGSPAKTPEISPAYLDWLRRTCSNVNLLGQEANKSYAFQLDHVYVPALTAAVSRPDLASGKSPQVTEDQRFVPLLQRLDKESLYVLAHAGVGKSTFCRWAVLRSIAGEDLCNPISPSEAFAEAVPERLRGRLPLLVPFREFAPWIDWGRGGPQCRPFRLQASAALALHVSHCLARRLAASPKARHPAKCSTPMTMPITHS